ncbi:MAG: hypothetical protein NC206_03430 [Bacteroides sp.]|nr:hypothetical protein [Roseburia sp.]MCM1346117.1 hypothetical protein [Bacteroides sp.]MCM1421188.1 hypothetical protein [Bacteroides sp.]
MNTHSARQRFKFVSFIMFAMICRQAAIAQSLSDDKSYKNLQGKWVLTTLDGEKDYDYLHSTFHQYKYYGESRFMMMTLVEKYDERTEETGLKPMRFACRWGYLSSLSAQHQVLEGKDTVSLDMKGRKYFRLNHLSGTSLSPETILSGETWKKSDYSKEGKLIVKAIAMTGKVSNRFTGLWKRDTVYVYQNVDGGLMGKMMPVADGKTYKFYGDKVSLLVTRIDFDATLSSCRIIGETRTQKYVSSSALEENGVQCLVGWENDDTFCLTYFDENRMPCMEVWRRTVLPNHIRSMFMEAE